MPGENNLKATAFSKERVESNEDSVRLVLESAETRPNLHLLVIGINRYEDSSFNLALARPDAEAVASFFEKKGSKLFGSVQVTKLFDREATLTNIRRAFQQVAERAGRRISSWSSWLDMA